MKRKIRKSLCIVLAAVLVVACAGMSGCGGNLSRENGEASENHAVSDSAVSEGQQSQAKGRYCTDTNLYAEALREDAMSGWEDSEYEMMESVICLVQTRLDGSCRKEIDLGEGFSSLIGVVDSWIYYMTQEGEHGQHVPMLSIYRVPIQKGEDGYDVVDTTKVEKMIDEKSGNVVDNYDAFVDDAYLIYGRENGEYSTEVVVYDLQKREEVDFGKNKMIIDEEGGYVFGIWRLGEQYAVLTEQELYMISPASAEWKNVLNDEYVKGYGIYNDRFVFYDCYPAEEDKSKFTPGPDYMDKDCIRVCDGEKDKGLITRKELTKAVESAAKSIENISTDELGEWQLSNLLCDGDRCYIEVQITGTHDGIYRMGYLVFSKAVGEEKIRLEENLIKSMRELDKEWEGRWYVEGQKKKKVIKEHSVVNPVCGNDIVNGKYYFYFYDDESKRHLAYYDLGTGETTEITRQSPAYYERFYGERHQMESEYYLQDAAEDFGYKDEQDILEMPILPEDGAEFEETKK